MITKLGNARMREPWSTSECDATPDFYGSDHIWGLLSYGALTTVVVPCIPKPQSFQERKTPNQYDIMPIGYTVTLLRKNFESQKKSRSLGRLMKVSQLFVACKSCKSSSGLSTSSQANQSMWIWSSINLHLLLGLLPPYFTSLQSVPKKYLCKAQKRQLRLVRRKALLYTGRVAGPLVYFNICISYDAYQ